MIRSNRPLLRGFTLFEVLVVLALLVVLFGLLLPLVQKIREAASRTSCANNMKQMALAMHNCNDTYGKLPPSVGAFPNATSDGTFHFYLLPFIEQDNLYKNASDGAGNFSVWVNNTHATQVRTFICPNDSSSGKSPVYQDWLATTNYACNFMVFALGGAKIPNSFPDGTSNTMVLVERYQVCNQTPTGWAYSGETEWAPIFAYSSYARFQVQPSQENCNPSLPQSIHGSGIQVGLGDGSVRLVHDSITPLTWYYATNPSDGNPLGADW
jgi:prepilin-type N-terminal cleavage/methylation domain-containing protein